MNLDQNNLSADLVEESVQLLPQPLGNHANNMANGVEEAFRDSTKEIKFEELKLAPLVFLDDIARMGEDRDSAQDANHRMEEMADSKQLSFNIQ